MVQGRELKYALSRALQSAAAEYLIQNAGQDLPEDQLTIGEFQFEVTRFDRTGFIIRAKPHRSDTLPLYFEVKITGGG